MVFKPTKGEVIHVSEGKVNLKDFLEDRAQKTIEIMEEYAQRGNTTVNVLDFSTPESMVESSIEAFADPNGYCKFLTEVTVGEYAMIARMEAHIEDTGSEAYKDCFEHAYTECLERVYNTIKPMY